MEEKTTFEKLRKLLRKSHAARLDNIKFCCYSEDIKTTEDRALSLTDWQRKNLDLEEARKVSFERLAKISNECHAEEMQKLEWVEAAELPSYIRILITQVKTEEGHQVKAKIWGLDHKVYESNLTRGFGYDKPSTAAAEILNQSAGALKILYKFKNEFLEDSKHMNQDASRALGYGSEGNMLPYWASAVGMSSICRTFERCGYEIRDEWEPDAPRDQVYLIVKK
ncbi:hypothetical protein J6U78_03805 [bacterium]|nr:hypothetical protein [bacterium]